MTAATGDLKRWLIVDEGADLVAGAMALSSSPPGSSPHQTASLSEVDRFLVGWARSRRAELAEAIPARLTSG